VLFGINEEDTLIFSSGGLPLNSSIWESDIPLVASEVTKKDESLNINTLQVVIRKLLNKKYIEVANILGAQAVR